MRRNGVDAHGPTHFAFKLLVFLYFFQMPFVLFLLSLHLGDDLLQDSLDRLKQQGFRN